MHAQRMLELSRCLRTGEFQTKSLENRREIRDLIYYHELTNYLFGGKLLISKYIMQSLHAQLTYIRKI